MKTTLRLRRNALPASAAANDNVLRPWKAVDWSALDRPEAPAAPVRRPIDWAALYLPWA